MLGSVKIGNLIGNKAHDYVYPPIEQKVAQLLKEEAEEKPFEEQFAEALAKNSKK